MDARLTGPVSTGRWNRVFGPAPPPPVVAPPRWPLLPTGASLTWRRSVGVIPSGFSKRNSVMTGRPPTVPVRKEMSNRRAGVEVSDRAVGAILEPGSTIHPD